MLIEIRVSKPTGQNPATGRGLGTKSLLYSFYVKSRRKLGLRKAVKSWKVLCCGFSKVFLQSTSRGAILADKCWHV